MKSEPFLWIHLTGLAVVPLCLEIVWLGFGIGVPIFPIWLELGLLVIVGAFPVLWMQWNRPFNFFGILFVSLRPDQLSSEQRQILRVYKSSQTKLFAVLLGICLIGVVWKLAQVSPLVISSIPFLPNSHLLGLLMSAVAFLASNLFLQVSVNALSLLLTKEETWRTVEPIEVEQVKQQFTTFGFQVRKLFSPLVLD